MQQIYRRWWLSLVLMALLVGGLAGCASSDAVPQCTDDFDCAFGESCNRDEGICQLIDFGRPGPQCSANSDCQFGEVCNVGMGRCEPIPSSEPDAGTPGNPDANSPDVQQPQTCNPACGPNQRCEQGQCVDNADPNACNPACGTGQTCQNGQCIQTTNPNTCSPACGPNQRCEQGQCVEDELPQCARQDDSCDPSTPDQGTFWCLTLQSGGGICSNKCQQEMTPMGCARGQICLNFADEGYAPALGCMSSQCTTDSDCTDGRVCHGFENEFNGCIDPTDPGGNQSDGQPCTSSGACAAGHVCIQETASQAVCRKECTLWQPPGQNGCPTNESCETLTDTKGFCTASIDWNATSVEASCSPQYLMCAVYNNQTNGMMGCFTSNYGDSMCLMYCRRGTSDCSTLGGSILWGDDYSCTNFGIIPDAPNVGVCTPN